MAASSLNINIESIRTEAVMVQFEVLSQNIGEREEENHVKPETSELVLRLKFEQRLNVM
jgi:hypothetical protein